MYDKLLFVRKILRLLYQFLFMILLGDLFLSSIYKPVLGVTPIIEIFVIMVLSYVLRDKVSHGIFMLLTHIAMSVGIFFIENNIPKRIVLVFVVSLCFFDGMNYILKGYSLKRMFDTPWEAMIFGLLTIALGAYYHNSIVTHIGYVIPIIMIILYLLAIYIEGLMNYVISAKDVSGIPIKQIVTTNSFIVSAVMLVIIILVVISDLLDFSGLAFALGKVFVGILKILGVIFLLIIKLLSAMSGTRENVTRQSMQQIEEIAEETNMLAVILETILYGLLILLTLFVIWKVFKKLIRIFLDRQDRRYDMTETLAADNSDKIKREKIKKKRQGRLTPEMKARSIYKKKVLSYKDNFQPDSTDTTKDILRAARRTEKEEYVDWPVHLLDEKVTEESMTEMYNRVRYGGEIPDKEFLKKMKELKL